MGHPRLCSFGSLTPAAAGTPPTGVLPTGLGRDSVPLHSICVFHSSFIYRRRCRKEEDEHSWCHWAGGCLLRHSPILWCSFMFHILPFCVYFTGVYFGEGSVYISVFTWSAHMLIFALLGLGIPPPPPLHSASFGQATSHGHQVEVSVCFQPPFHSPALGLLTESALTKPVHASKSFRAWPVSALPIPSTSQCTRGGQM